MKQIDFRRIALLAATAAMLTGCNIYKKFSMPTDDPLRQAYVEVRAEADTIDTLGNIPWQQVFTDPQLASLIQLALDNNIDLANAKLNVDIAHANLRGARLAYLPSLAIAPQGGASSVSNGPLQGWNYTIPLTASWEIDVFGKMLNNKRSAEAAERQAGDYARAVRSQLIGSVANCYYTISTLKAQLLLTRSTAEIWQENVATMRNFKEAGRTNEAAVVQAEANYYSVLASIPDLEASIVKMNNTLSVLLNVEPREWDIPADALPIDRGFVMDEYLMRAIANRPDVSAAEEALAIAYYATNSARAAFYPTLTVNGTYGFTNSLGSFIQNPGTWFASLAGQLAAPLFSRGQNIARLDAAKAQQEQALNNFRKTLLNAMSEVHNAMTSCEAYSQKQQLIEYQVDDLEKAVEYTKLLFASAGSTYLEILTAQSSLLQAKMALLESRLGEMQSIVQLYQALGGGRSDMTRNMSN